MSDVSGPCPPLGGALDPRRLPLKVDSADQGQGLFLYSPLIPPPDPLPGRWAALPPSFDQPTHSTVHGFAFLFLPSRSLHFRFLFFFFSDDFDRLLPPLNDPALPLRSSTLWDAPPFFESRLY